MFNKAVAAGIIFILVCLVWNATREFRKGVVEMVKRAFRGGSGGDTPTDGGAGSSPNAS